MFFSVSVLVSLLATSVSVSALATPYGHNARDMSLAARHHHIARQASTHPVARRLPRRLSRRKNCPERQKPAPTSSSSSSPPEDTGIHTPKVPVDIAYTPNPTTTTTSTQAPVEAATPYSPPAPTTTPDSSSSTGSGQSHHGDGTFFDVGLGACGKTSANSDHMVAIGWQLFDSFGTGDQDPNHNPVCGKQIRASSGGKSVTVVVLDRCGGCKPDDLDFSPSAFNQLADPSVGRLTNVEWQFV